MFVIPNTSLRCFGRRQGFGGFGDVAVVPHHRLTEINLEEPQGQEHCLMAQAILRRKDFSLMFFRRYRLSP